VIEFGYVTDPDHLAALLLAGAEVWFEPPNILYRIERTS
jgi:hypothetical protein